VCEDAGVGIYIAKNSKIAINLKKLNWYLFAFLNKNLKWYKILKALECN
jgi:hypothetical protein